MERNELEYDGPELARIHRQQNARKAETYWLGFLQGILASAKVEKLEVPSLRAEAERFLALFGDADAAELLRDLDTNFDNFEQEIYEIVECIVQYRSKHAAIENARDWTNRFYGFCAGIACDDRITVEEVEWLLHDISNAPFPITDARILSLEKVARYAIADRRITDEEAEDISGWIGRLVGDSCAETGLATYGNAANLDDCLRDTAKIAFEGAVFVVTGKFRIAPRKVLRSLVEQRGGVLGNAVSSQTDYLVVAAECSRDWIYSHEGTKIVKARELREKAGRPHLIEEVTFREALGEVL